MICRLARKAGYALPFLRIAIVTGLGMGVAGQAFAFECPTAKPTAGPGILKETSAQIADMADLLASGDVGNKIRFIMLHLKTRYPGVENAEIANYILTGYCPLVAKDSSLSEEQKQAKMDEFVRQLFQIIY